MSRNWCPAVAAQPESFSGPNRVPSPPRPSSPKDKGAVAARNGLLSSQKGGEVLTKVHKSQVFSPKIAISTSLLPQSSQSVVAAEHAVKVVPQDDAEAKAANINKKMFSMRYSSVGHLQASLEDGTVKASVNVNDVPLSTQALSQCFENPSFQANTVRMDAERTLHGTHGIITVAKHAAAKDHLKALNLSSNAAGFGVEEPTPEALEALAKYVQSTKSLEELNLSNNNLGSGAATLGPALLANSSLLSVNLSNNAIGTGEESVAAVTQWIQENKFVLAADLGENDLNGGMCRQLLDALATSDTRVATPEPEEEPAPEEYADDLGPEEEAPTVKIGFPEEEKPEGEAAEEGEAALAAGEEAAAAAAPAKEKTGEDEEGEEEEEEEAKEEAKAEEEVEEDEDEKAERLAREEEERLEALAQAEEEWRAKMGQYIWEPERLHFEYNEAVERRKILQEHVDTTTALKKDEMAGRQAAKKSQLAREKRDRERRSGWSHLQSLSLAGNPMGLEGSKALALMLRKSIPLTEEEFAAAEDKERERIAEERAKAAEERRAAAEAAAEARAAAKEAAAEAKAAARAKAEEEAAERGEELPPEPEEEEQPAEEEEQPKEEEEGEGKEEEPIVVKVDKDRKGVRTLTSLNVGECAIPSKGLVALSNTLKDNCPSLVSLNLRKNKFGAKKKEIQHPEYNEEDEEPKPNIRVFVPGWVSPGVEALAATLAVNRTLKILDLSYNSMFPGTIRALAKGLKENVGLEYLNLAGNNIGAEVQGQAAAEEPPILTELLSSFGGADCQLKTLILDNNKIGGGLLSETCCEALAKCHSVKNLSLAANGLDNSDMRLIAGSYFAVCGETTGLKSLNLDNNALRGQSGGQAVGEVLRRCPNLKAFSIKDNVSLGDAGFCGFMIWLVNHSAIQSLNIHRTGITSFGPLTTSLPSISFLSHIDAGDNSIPEHSVRQFLESCRQSPSLKSLCFWSRLGDFSASLAPLLTDIATACPSLIFLDLGVPLVNPSLPAATEEEEPDDLELLELQLLKNRSMQEQNAI